MTIATILRNKGGHVVSVGPGEDVGAICRSLAEHRIGAALVRGMEGEVLGIISERDIVRMISRDGAAALALTARQVMTTGLHTAEPAMPIVQALELMTDRRIRHLPVMEGAKLVGMVSIGDLVKARIEAAVTEAESLRAFVTAA